MACATNLLDVDGQSRKVASAHTCDIGIPIRATILFIVMFDTVDEIIKFFLFIDECRYAHL